MDKFDYPGHGGLVPDEWVAKREEIGMKNES